MKVSLEKALEQNELFGIGMNAELKNITFGLYAQTDIVAADGTMIPEGGLIEIIIFDEPTNGLDVLTAKVVTDFLLELKKEGKSIIVSTHIFSLIEKICDRVGIIIKGEMIICDTLEAVKNGKSLEDRFFEIYEETVGEAE